MDDISKNKNSNEFSISKDDIKPNLKVWVTSLNQEGIVLSNISKSNEVLVQVGSIRMNVNITLLKKPQNTEISFASKVLGVKQKHIQSSYSTSNKDTKSSSISYKISKTRNISSEINVIGETVLDATALVDKFLDDCALAKLQTVRIVHGKGTGKLKDGIHAFLRHNPHVKSFRMGTFGEGEMGVTVVELK